MTPRSKPQALYVHVPFCRSICYYCDFTHVMYSQDTADRWLQALSAELSARDISRHLKTVYIGGGTPSSLNSGQLETLLTLLAPCTREVTEYTCEINPETVDPEKAGLLAAHGVSRISIGFQTGSEKLLKSMGRHHSAADVKRVMDLFRSFGISNISLDLMYSLPQQTMDDLKEAVDTAIALNPTHLSLYSLTVEENTVFGRRGYESLDEDTEADMYEYICRTLPEHGFRQYEISNFAKEGCESRHNKTYWTYRDFYGVSCGASGKEGLTRYDVTPSLKEYLKDPLKREEIHLSVKDAMFEMVMMNLRLKDGMDLRLFSDTFGVTFEEAFRGKYEPLAENGMLTVTGGRAVCTEKGYHLLNSILADLL